MFQALRRIINPSVSDSLANSFSRLGWTGFWIQIVIGIVPLALIIYAQSSGGTTRRGTLLVGYLTIAGFLVLIFTTVWFTGTLVLRNASPIRRCAHLYSWCKKLPG